MDILRCSPAVWNMASNQTSFAILQAVGKYRAGLKTHFFAQTHFWDLLLKIVLTDVLDLVTSCSALNGDDVVHEDL